MIRFAKPSVRRALVCVAVVTVFVCVVVGIAMSTAMIVGSSAPTSTGEYVRLFIVNITMWGPIMVITAWFLSAPVVLAVGVLVACIHVVDPPNEAESTEADRSRLAARDDLGNEGN